MLSGVDSKNKEKNTGIKRLLAEEILCFAFKEQIIEIDEFWETNSKYFKSIKDNTSTSQFNQSRFY
ncbi:8356_t:CDS:2 [Gigaspora margarita]|uniref:8356_t:CDS:1 n=1 Tax=Gigaspora margarita TaxID=4874 RepID=A0ABN7UYZ1_GIGMA|nr:8356_t:CDS:2 [Gigaspora margarita]